MKNSTLRQLFFLKNPKNINSYYFLNHVVRTTKFFQNAAVRWATVRCLCHQYEISRMSQQCGESRRCSNCKLASVKHKKLNTKLAINETSFPARLLAKVEYSGIWNVRPWWGRKYRNMVDIRSSWSGIYWYMVYSTLGRSNIPVHGPPWRCCSIVQAIASVSQNTGSAPELYREP